MKINVKAIDVFKKILDEGNFNYFADFVGLSNSTEESVEVSDANVIFYFTNGVLTNIQNLLQQQDSDE